MGSIWNRMKSGPMTDLYQGDGETSSDDLTSQASPPALLTLSSRENRVNKSQSAHQPTCEERIHYPIYDPRNPDHNPGIARSRSSTLWATRFPITPKSKAAHPAKSGSWTSRSPVKSLRKAKSGFLALAEELRSKPSFCRGDSTSNYVTSSSGPVSPSRQNREGLGDINSTEPESSCPTASPSIAAPILKLDIASSQMSLSPFAISPSESSREKTPSLDESSVTRPSSNFFELPTVGIISSPFYKGPSLLPLPSAYAPLEDPFQNSLTQSLGPGDRIKASDNADLIQGPPEEHDSIALKTATAEENSDVGIKNCNTGDINGVPIEGRSVYPVNCSSPPVEEIEQQEGTTKYHALNDSESYSEEAQSHSTQSPKLQGKQFGSAPMIEKVKAVLPTKDDMDPLLVNPDNGNLTSQEHHSPDLPGTSDFEANEMLSETSTEEDSDLGVEIYRTRCLSEQNPGSPSLHNVAAMAIRPILSLDGEKPEKSSQFQISSQSSSIQTTRVTVTATTDKRSMESKRPSSEGTSSKSTIRWEDGFVRHETPNTNAGCSSTRSDLRTSKTFSITSHTGGAPDDIQPPRRSSLSSDSHHHYIGTKDNIPLAPTGDRRFTVEAIERKSGLQLNSSSESFPLPIRRKNTDSSVNTEPILKQIPSRGGDNYAENRSRSNSRNTYGSDKSKPHNGETTSDSHDESIPLTVSQISQRRETTGSDGVPSRKESSGGNSTKTSQAGSRSDDTAVGTHSTASSTLGSYTIPEGVQSVNTKAKPEDLKKSWSSTDENGYSAQGVRNRIVSGGSIHSGPGLDREAPSKGPQTVLPEAIGPGSLCPGGSKSRESHSNAIGDWSSGSDDCGYAPWYAQKGRRGQ